MDYPSRTTPRRLLGPSGPETKGDGPKLSSRGLSISFTETFVPLEVSIRTLVPKTDNDESLVKLQKIFFLN